MAIVEQLSPYITLLLWIAVRYVVKKFFFYIYYPLYVIFRPRPSTLCCALKSNKLMERNYVRGEVFCINLCLSLSCHIKRNKKVKIEVFEPIGAAIFTDRYTYIN